MRSRTFGGYFCMLAALMGPLAAFSSSLHDPSGVRLLNSDQGLTLVNTASKHREQVSRKPDCSHLVHQIEARPGFPRPHASAFDLYQGIDNFSRFPNPRAGALVVCRGHVGIVVDPAE